MAIDISSSALSVSIFLSLPHNNILCSQPISTSRYNPDINMSLQSILPNLKSRPANQNAQTTPLVGLLQLVNENFSLSTWLLLGACFQASIALIVQNKYYAFLPAVLILSARIINAVMIHFKIKPNPYLEKVVFKKAAAVVPDGNGNFTGAGQEKIAVLLLGAKSNHPFGAFAPEFLKMFKYLSDMNAEFEKENGPNGCKCPLSFMEYILPSYN